MPVLFVVPDRRRQEALARWALAEARRLGADPTIFLVTTRGALSERTVLASPIWQVAGGPPALALLARGAAPAAAAGTRAVRPQVLL